MQFALAGGLNAIFSQVGFFEGMARVIFHGLRSRRRAAWLVCAVLPAGCGGDDATGPVRTTPPVSYSTYDAQSAALHAAWDGAGYTAPGNLPLGGSAQFDGVMRLHLEGAGGDVPVNGALSVQVAFASDSLSGSASGFAGADGAAYSGTLAITNGALDRAADPLSEYTFSANMAGTLSAGADSYAISADVNGDFLGAAYGAMTGLVAGTATTGSGTGYVFGDFIAAR